MKKSLFLIVFIMFLAFSPAHSMQLEGEVVEQVKQEAFNASISKKISTQPYKIYSAKSPKGYRNDFNDGGYAIHRNKEMLSYKNGKLVMIGKSDKNVFEFPRKTVRYDYPSGRVNSICYYTSPKDCYIFNPDGSLSIVVKDNVAYKNNVVIRSAKTTDLK